MARPEYGNDAELNFDFSNLKPYDEAGRPVAKTEITTGAWNTMVDGLARRADEEARKLGVVPKPITAPIPIFDQTSTRAIYEIIPYHELMRMFDGDFKEIPKMTSTPIRPLSFRELLDARVEANDDYFRGGRFLGVVPPKKPEEKDLLETLFKVDDKRESIDYLNAFMKLSKQDYEQMGTYFDVAPVPKKEDRK